MRNWICAALAACLVFVPTAFAWDDNDSRERYAALARLYGHIRFYHPSDQAQDHDWGRVMVHGVREVRDAQDPESLADALRNVFGPIAPSVVVTSGALPEEHPAPSGGPYTHWEHTGVGYGPGSNVYQSVRVGIDGDSVLDLTVAPGEVVDIELGAGVRARVPLSLAIEDGMTLPRPGDDELARWRSTIENLEIGNATDQDTRIASTLMAWSVLSHFFPYFDRVGVDWDERLDIHIAKAIQAQSEPEFYRTVREQMADLGDGHGYVHMDDFFPWSPKAPAARFDVARDGSIVVTRSWDNCPLRHGDVVVSVDDRTGPEELARLERMTPGSAHLSRHRALKQFGMNNEGGPALYVVRRIVDGREREIALNVELTEYPGYYFTEPEFDHPPISEVAQGVWLLNLRTLTKAAWDEHLDDIKRSRGLIVDFRWGDGPDPEINAPTLIGHFYNKPMVTQMYEVPGTVRPGFREVEWVTRSFTMDPLETGIETQVAFLTSPVIISWGESILSLWVHHLDPYLVGEPTAGCNGNINRIEDLPSGMYPNFTGMRVRKHDGSTLYGVGYQPDVPVNRTLDEIRSGEDIALQEAIKLLSD